MKRAVTVVLFFVFYFISIVAPAQENTGVHKPRQHRHEKYATIKNPVPMTVQSISQGRKLYEKHCMSCHGESGKRGISPDLTDTVWIHGSTDGEIFKVIADGVPGTAMREFKKELTERMRWHLVNYIKSLQKTEGSQ